MGYTPNNPLVPGDPYSYDLKWMVEEIKKQREPEEEAAAAAASAAEALAHANNAAASALTAANKATQAGNSAANASNAALNAQASAQDAQDIYDNYHAEVIADAVQEAHDAAENWLALNITQPTTPAIDASLSVAGAAADAKATGDAISAMEIEIAAFEKSEFVNAFDVGTYSGYITPSGGIGANANYCYSAMMLTKPGDIWLYNGKNTSGGISVIWGYATAAGTGAVALVPAGNVSGYAIGIVPSGVNYVRATSLVQSQHGNPIGLLHAPNTLFYDASLGSIRTFFSNYISGNTKTNPFKVYVLPGSYSFDNEFTAAELADSNFKGVTVPAWTTLIGIERGKVSFSLTLSSGSISTFNLLEGASLQNMEVIGELCRYAVHDDFGGTATLPFKYFKNCRFVANACSYGYAYGGGCRSGSGAQFDNCEFVGLTHDDGAFLMHSNTGFTVPCLFIFNDCIFDSQNGHYERAINIRGLGNTSVVSQMIFNNCKTTGYYLEANTVWDWHVTGSGNSIGYALVTNPLCKLDFADAAFVNDGSTASDYAALAVGSFRFNSTLHKPQWWDGSAWIDANGN